MPGKGIFHRQLLEVCHRVVDIELVIDGHVFIGILLVDQAPEKDELPEVEIRRADDAADPDPVVVIVRVTGTVVVEAVKVTVDGLKLQVL